MKASLHHNHTQSGQIILLLLLAGTATGLWSKFLKVKRSDKRIQEIRDGAVEFKSNH